MDRARTLQRLASETFDLLVIGAGIIGSRIAYEAARSGATVALLDAGDFGGATSSSSSKLIHGGLRYLQMGDLGLVRESHLERRALLRQVAPHLVRPLPFVVPVYRGGPHRASTLAAGLLLYSALSGFRSSRGRLVGASAARRLVPPLRTDGMVAAGIYMDAQTHDSRLALATVSGAARFGAAVLNHAPVSSLEIAGRRVVAARAGDVLVRCRDVVNAAGPWVDRVRRLEDGRADPMVRLSKGVHVTIDAPEPWSAALTTFLDRGRVAFAVPWEGMLMLGTTDTDHEGEPEAAVVEESDIATVLREAAIALPSELLRRDRVRHSFAGLRALPRTDGDSAQAPREHLVRTGPAGMVSVAGGKLTTHRRIATDVLWRLARFREVRFGSEALPGGGPLPRRPGAVDPEVWEHLCHLYGDLAPRVLAAGSVERLAPAGPDIRAQVDYAAEHEWATTVGDVLRRRTTVEVRGLATDELRTRVAATLSARGVFQETDGR